MADNDSDTAMNETASIVEFVKLIPQGRQPKRADKSGAGSLPGRAMRYCEALRSATGYGYWLFPPMDLQLLWDGDLVFWSCDGTTSWHPLSGTESGAIQFPGYAEAFNDLAPEWMQGLSPPFLTALPELGTVQIWTGLLARTKPGWSLNVRMPVNLPAIPGLTAWEGIVETDHWFGPLFTNFRITKTDQAVYLRSQVPFMQVQPLPQVAYQDDTLNPVPVRTAGEISEQDWQELAHVLQPSGPENNGPGAYAVKLRKRRGCPQHASLSNLVLS